jgi:hypothetical protein
VAGEIAGFRLKFFSRIVSRRVIMPASFVFYSWQPANTAKKF